jgi:hypothetical protein
LGLHPIHHLRAKDDFKILFSPVDARAICQLFQVCLIGQELTGCPGSAACNPGSDQNYLTRGIVGEAGGDCIVFDNLTGQNYMSIIPATAESVSNLPSTIQYTDENGNPQIITVCYGTVSVALPALCGGTGGGGCGPLVGSPVTSGWIVVPTEIILQNGDQYTFSYTPNPGDPNPMGEITSMTLPTGGVIEYTWGGWANELEQGSFNAATGRQLASRTVIANGQTSTWNYHYTPNPGTGFPSSVFQTVTVTDPYQNDTVYTCDNNPNNVYAGAQTSPSCRMTKEVTITGAHSRRTQSRLNRPATLSWGIGFNQRPRLLPGIPMERRRRRILPGMCLCPL